MGVHSCNCTRQTHESKDEQDEDVRRKKEERIKIKNKQPTSFTGSRLCSLHFFMFSLPRFFFISYYDSVITTLRVFIDCSLTYFLSIILNLFFISISNVHPDLYETIQNDMQGVSPPYFRTPTSLLLLKLYLHPHSLLFPFLYLINYLYLYLSHLSPLACWPNNTCTWSLSNRDTIQSDFLYTTLAPERAPC